MTQEAHARVLSVIVCGAGPATAIGTFVGLAQERGWTPRMAGLASQEVADLGDGR